MTPEQSLLLEDTHSHFSPPLPPPSLPQLTTTNFTLELPTTNSVSNSSNKPVHMHPKLPEGDISSGLHMYVARQTDRQTDRQVDRQTDGPDHLHLHEDSILQSDSSVRSQRGEVTDTVVERHMWGTQYLQTQQQAHRRH